jgi:NAD(P)-dependent dehydrogenase (short-subunit alcohol dehydrogenase family)
LNNRLLEDKTVWITGGASYPYDAYASLFARHGAYVITIDQLSSGAAYRERSIDVSNMAFRERSINGANVTFRECDLYDAASVESVCDALLSEGAVPDVYLHVADEYGAAYIDELDYPSFARMLELSLLTPFAAVRRIAGPMAENGGGAVVFVSGHYGVQAINRVSGYGAAKGGQISLAYSLAAEFAEDNIRVNAIVPGVNFPPVGDEILAQSGSVDSAEFWNTVQPFPRRGRMDELANAALFLASDMSAHISGETLHVDGAERLIAHNHSFPGRNMP